MLRILVVEDNLALLDSIVEILSDEFKVDQAADGEDGLYEAMQNIYDAIVLDVMLPEIDGFQIIQRMRKENINTQFYF